VVDAVQELLAPEAAHGDDVFATRYAGAETQRRDFRAQLLEAGDSHGIECTALKGCNGHRGFLKVLGALFRGHHDGFDLCQCAGAQKADSGDPAHQGDCFPCAHFSPLCSSKAEPAVCISPAADPHPVKI